MKLSWAIFGIMGFCLLIFPGSAVPGDILWQQVLGGTHNDWGYSLDTYPDGGIIATGIVYSPNITGYHGNGDLYAVRLNPNGTLLWQRAFGGNESDYGLSVKITLDGGSVIIGTTGSNTGDVTGYHGNGDLWAIRLSSSGDKVWEKTYGGNLTEEGGDIITTPDGGYMMVGYSMSIDGDVTGNHGGGDLWMIRIDQSGKILWQKCLGGSKRDSGSSIIHSSDGNYVMCGNSYSSDGDVTGNHGSSDVWVVKTDANGTILWQKAYGGSKLDWGHSVIELPGGDLMVAGVTASADGNVKVNHGVGDIWVLRLSPRGDLIWEKTYGGSYSDNVWKLDSSPRGGAYLVGETYSVDGDITGNHGDADLWVSEIDANGSLLWKRAYGGGNYDSGSWIKELPDGNLAITGITQSHDGDLASIHAAGSFWVVKIDSGLAASKVQQNVPNLSSVSPVKVNATPVMPVNVIPQDNSTHIQIPVQNITQSQPYSVAVNNTSPVFTRNTTLSVNLTTSQTLTGNRTLVPLPGFIKLPTSPKGDGKYTDLDGDGKLDKEDVRIFFYNIDWVRANEPVSDFDFNGNGIIDYGDISALSAKVT